MWGFLKCNYSYTKILIVLLFSPSPLFFCWSFFFFSPQGRVIPPYGPAQAVPGSLAGGAQRGPSKSCLQIWMLGEAARVWAAAGPGPPPAASRPQQQNDNQMPGHSVISQVMASARSMPMALGLVKFSGWKVRNRLERAQGPRPGLPTVF